MKCVHLVPTQLLPVPYRSLYSGTLYRCKLPLMRLFMHDNAISRSSSTWTFHNCKSSAWKSVRD